MLSSHRKWRVPLMFEQYPFLGIRIFHSGRSHGCCSVHATGCSLPCGRYLLAPLTRNNEGSKSLIVLRVKPTPTRFPSNMPYTRRCILYQVCAIRGTEVCCCLGMNLVAKEERTGNQRCYPHARHEVLNCVLLPPMARSLFHSGRSHGCCPVRTTRGSLPCGRYIPAPLTGNVKGNTNSVPDQHN